MIYLDTSALGAVFFRERAAESVTSALRATSRSPHIISAWTLTEMASVGALKVRTGAVTDDERTLALSTFQRFSSAKLRTVEVEPIDFRAAAVLIAQVPNLRGGDALHLAIAKRLGATLATLDRRLEAGAASLGLRTLSLTPSS